MPINSFENYPMSWKPTLQQNKNRPLYLSLSSQLEEDIQNGILKPGTKLPPQRELADFLDINVSTVSRAFKLCSQKGLLSGTVGSGTYVAYDIFTNILSAPTAGQASLIELGSMMPETLSQEEVVSLLQKMMAEDSFGKLLQYNHGLEPWQKQAAVKLLKEVGCSPRPHQILVASGGQNGLAAIFAGLFQPSDRLGVDPLVYPGVKSAAKLFGIQLIPIRQENGEMSEKGIRYAVKNEGIKALYVMPDYQNPTTHTMNQKGRETIARMAKELDLFIIEDGIANLLSAHPHKSIFTYAPEHTVFLLSLSKTINPALRLAYLAVPDRFLSLLDNALYNLNLSQSTLLMELSARLIVSGQLEKLLERRRQGLHTRNRLAEKILAGYPLLGDENCLSRWLPLPSGVTGLQLEQLALEKGVLVYGAERFAVGKNPPLGGVRLAICAPETLEALEQGLTILREILKGYYR